jgi:hypothetical protein
MVVGLTDDGDEVLEGERSLLFFFTDSSGSPSVRWVGLF